MSASFPQPQPSSARADALATLKPVEIETSARLPVILLFCGAAIWLLVSAKFAFMASLKFHSPNFFANGAWLTYGRIYPAHLNAFIYGFAIPAGLGVCLWLLAKIGETRLAFSGVATLGALFWNLGVLIGVVGILNGDSTGFEWLEFPRNASPILFFGYALIGIAALLTINRRRVWELCSTQWFIIAALFWFPWVYTTANLLLVFMPLRGVMQALIDWWFINNLAVWFNLVGVAVIFHFIPAGVGRPLQNRSLALFAFWLLLLVAPWAGIPSSAPVPAWIPAISMVASVLLIVPVIAIVINVHQTIGGECSKIKQSSALRFIQFGLPAFVISNLLNAVTSIPQISAITNFTWLVPAQTHLALFGFFAMTIFGAIYEIVPRLVQKEFPSQKLVRLHFYCATPGLLLFFISLATGGVAQGLALADSQVPFAQVLGKTLMFLRVSTLGELLIGVGCLFFAINLFWLLLRLGRACCLAKCKAVEVIP